MLKIVSIVPRKFLKRRLPFNAFQITEMRSFTALIVAACRLSPGKCRGKKVFTAV